MSYPAPLRSRLTAWLDPPLTRKFMADISAVDALVADLETEARGIPVLLRHYLNLGGEILAFNLDPDFSNVIDGLILVDLDRADPKTLQRYLGRAGLAQFYAQAPGPSFTEVA